jgi:hypothetical protein
LTPLKEATSFGVPISVPSALDPLSRNQIAKLPKNAEFGAVGLLFLFITSGE